MQDLQQKIRERAYHMWIENGRREGAADSFWIEAEREVLASFAATTSNGAASAEAKPVKKAPVKAKKRAA